MIVDGVDEVLTVERDPLDEPPSADTSLIASIAKIGERLVVLLDPSTIFATA